MATNFPTSLDNSTSLPYPSSGNFTNAPSLAGLNDNQNDALIATQTKIGIGASTPTSGKFLTGTGTGTSAWANTVPAGTVVGTSDSQTLTNKTLTSPTISSPVITNATISTDLITGYTTSNTGTVYGIPVTTGVINTAGTINGASLVASSITSSALAANSVTSTAIADLNVGRTKINWSTFSNNIKSTFNTSAPALTNSDQDLASSGLSLSFTCSGTAYAFVTVALGISSTTDFEFQPEIRLGGVTQAKYIPVAAPANASSRPSVRTFSYGITLVNGVNTLSAGVLLLSATSPSWQIGAGSISAIVFGNVTA